MEITCVNAMVSLQLATFLEGLVTFWTLVGRGLESQALSRGVSLLVFLQVACPLESLMAHLPTNTNKTKSF